MAASSIRNCTDWRPCHVLMSNRPATWTNRRRDFPRHIQFRIKRAKADAVHRCPNTVTDAFEVIAAHTFGKLDFTSGITKRGPQHPRQTGLPVPAIQPSQPAPQRASIYRLGADPWGQITRP